MNLVYLLFSFITPAPRPTPSRDNFRLVSSSLAHVLVDVFYHLYDKRTIHRCLPTSPGGISTQDTDVTLMGGTSIASNTASDGSRRKMELTNVWTLNKIFYVFSMFGNKTLFKSSVSKLYNAVHSL